MTAIDVVDSRINDYAARMSTAPSASIAALEQRTSTREDAGMLCGHVVAGVLATLVHATRAQRVLEIGTFTGYATVTMAGALAPTGHIVTLEVDPELARAARATFDDAGVGERIRVVEGPALESIASLEGPFDVVFIDAAKEEYGAYLDAVLPLLAPHGVIVVDNTLWSGRVLDPDDETTEAIAGFNERVAADPGLAVVQLTVRDGVTLIRRST